MIKQIKFVSIPVRDQNRALDFYTDKLGFTIITDQPFDEKQRWIELRIPKAETRVVLFTPEGDEKRIGSFMNMSYACDDIDKTYEELKKRGVEFEGSPQKQPWGTGALFVFLSAALRTWGTAYLRTEVVHDHAQHSEALVADGPFRYTRNPLYLANLPMATGVGVLASRSGFVFLLLANWIFVYRLIFREEESLLKTQGDRK